MILTTAAFAASDSTVKVIGATVPLLVLLWVRYLFQMIVLGTWMVRLGDFSVFRTGSAKLQILRGRCFCSPIPPARSPDCATCPCP